MSFELAGLGRDVHIISRPRPLLRRTVLHLAMTVPRTRGHRGTCVQSRIPGFVVARGVVNGGEKGDERTFVPREFHDGAALGKACPVGLPTQRERKGGFAAGWHALHATGQM